MGFHAGNYTIPQLIAEIAAELVATPDWEMIDEDYSGGYALRYIPDSTYMTIATKAGGIIGMYNADWKCYATGIAIRFASAYDIATHSIDGTYQNGIVPLFSGSNVTPSISLLDETHTYPVKYWVDRYGFVAAIDTPYDNNDSSGALVVLEAPPAAWREYSDGFRLPSLHVLRNNNRFKAYTNSSNYPVGDNSTSYYYQNLRPFNIATHTDLVEYSSCRSAYRANSNSKIYFEFPYTHNSKDYKTPYMQTRRFFLVHTAAGLAVDDIVSWLDVDGVTVRKFIIAQISSPDTTAKYYAAIPYDNAYDYGA